MNRHLPLFLFLALAATPDARAAGLCRPFADFGAQAKRCEDNSVIGNEALGCLDRYHAAVKAGKKKVKAALKAQVARMKSQQSDSFDRSDSSYQDTRAELRRLIAEGLAAKVIVDAYFDELFLPEDFDNPSVTGMSPEEYVKQEPCYAVPKNAVNTASTIIGKMVKDLQKTDAAAAQLERTSARRSTNVRVNDAQGASVRGGAAQGSAKLKREKESSSDITGVKEDAAKRAKVPAKP